MDRWFQEQLVAEIPNLRKYAQILTKGKANVSADDVLQDTLVAAMDGWMGFTKDTNMRGWTLTIMRHAFLRLVQKRNRHAAISFDDEAFPEALMPTVTPDLSALFLADAARLLAILPEDQRLAVHLRCVQGLSIAETAERLGVEPGTVKSRIHRARARIRDVLDAGDLPTKIRHQAIRANKAVVQFQERCDRSDRSVPAPAQPKGMFRR